MGEAEEESEYEYSDYEEDSDDELVRINVSPYSSLPLPDFSEDEVRTAKELSDWLKLVCDSKSNWIKNILHENRCDSDNDNSSSDNDNNEDLVEEYSEDCRDICDFYGETDTFGRLHGDAEICLKNGDKVSGYFHHGIKHGKTKTTTIIL